jgi:hypothetical protein
MDTHSDGLYFQHLKKDKDWYIWSQLRQLWTNQWLR